jgi:hypothetical protein
MGFLGILALYFLFDSVSKFVSWLKRGRQARQLENQVHGPLLACARIFSETMSQSFVKSAGNVINPLHSVGAIDARLANAYHTLIGTLATSARYFASDFQLKRLSSVEMWQRLRALHSDYIRLCRDLASAIPAGQREDLRRSWDEIREHANSFSNRLSEIGALLHVNEGTENSHPYFENIPRSYP